MEETLTGTPDNSEIICGSCVQLFLNAPKSNLQEAFQKTHQLKKQIADRLESVSDSSEKQHLKEIQKIYSNKIKAISVFLRPEDREESYNYGETKNISRIDNRRRIDGFFKAEKNRFKQVKI